MNLKLLALVALAAFVVACSSSHFQGAGDEQVALNAQEEVIKEIQDRKSFRSPASLSEDLNAQLKDLSKVSPGKFEVYVFPKISNQNAKTADESEHLGRPQVYEVSVLAVSPCDQFINKKLFAKYSPDTAFPGRLAENKANQCSIVEVTSMGLQKMGKGNLRADDLLKMRLFLDDKYVVHAVDHEIYDSPNSNRIARVKNVNAVGVSSGLSLFPVEFPAAWAKRERMNLAPKVAEKVDGVGVFQIQKRLNKKFSLPNCSGMLFEQKDPVGGTSRIGWCEKMPWPSFIENGRFVSVLQPISVK